MKCQSRTMKIDPLKSRGLQPKAENNVKSFASEITDSRAFGDDQRHQLLKRLHTKLMKSGEPTKLEGPKERPDENLKYTRQEVKASRVGDARNLSRKKSKVEIKKKVADKDEDRMRCFKRKSTAVLGERQSAENTIMSKSDVGSRKSQDKVSKDNMHKKKKSAESTIWIYHHQQNRLRSYSRTAIPKTSQKFRDSDAGPKQRTKKSRDTKKVKPLKSSSAKDISSHPLMLVADVPGLVSKIQELKLNVEQLETFINQPQ